MRTALLSAGLALALLGCAALSTPLVRFADRPVSSPSQTAEPQPSRTPSPTATPLPTQTPTIVPRDTPLPTVTSTGFILRLPPSSTPRPTATGASPTPQALDCKLVWQSPGYRTPYKAGERFGAGWNIKNIGTDTWDSNTFALVYLGGAKLSTTDVVRLPESVSPGDSVIVSVPMRAPWRTGMYTTHWGLRQANNFFCRLTVTILAD